jgi:hypothetical protein
VNIHFTDPRPGEMEMLAQAGFRWVRMDANWAGTEREKGVYDFSAYDRFLDTLDKHGIRALLILDFFNALYDNGMSPVSDEGVAAFARWAAAMVHHFHGRGVLWEMYNEPNSDEFWRPKANAQQYAKLAVAVAKAVREVEPDETLFGPAIVGVIGPSMVAVDGPEATHFLETCFTAGLLEYWGGVSVHPYRRTVPETVAVDYARLRPLIDQYAPKNKTVPILAGEWGYCNVWETMDEAKQADYLAREFLTNLANNIPLTIWYDWHDDGLDPKDPEQHFGTVAFPYFENETPVYRPKPAYWAAKTLTTALNGYRFEKRLAIGGDTDYVFEFVNGEKKRYVAWSCKLPAVKPVKIPAPAGTYSAIGCTGHTLERLSADADGLPVELKYSPTYFVLER